MLIENPSYFIKGSEDNESHPILMDTYTEDCHDLTSPIHSYHMINNGM